MCKKSLIQLALIIYCYIFPTTIQGAGSPTKETIFDQFSVNKVSNFYNLATHTALRESCSAHPPSSMRCYIRIVTFSGGIACEFAVTYRLSQRAQVPIISIGTIAQRDYNYRLDKEFYDPIKKAHKSDELKTTSNSTKLLQKISQQKIFPDHTKGYSPVNDIYIAKRGKRVISETSLAIPSDNRAFKLVGVYDADSTSTVFEISLLYLFKGYLVISNSSSCSTKWKLNDFDLFKEKRNYYSSYPLDTKFFISK